MFALMDKWLYELPKKNIRKVHIEEKDVRDRLKDIVKNVDIARYIL
jgi:ATP-dependent protease HslVU (ClpYQ) ATPase subunit